MARAEDGEDGYTFTQDIYHARFVSELRRDGTWGTDRHVNSSQGFIRRSCLGALEGCESPDGRPRRKSGYENCLFPTVIVRSLFTHLRKINQHHSIETDT